MTTNTVEFNDKWIPILVYVKRLTKLFLNINIFLYEEVRGTQEFYHNQIHKRSYLFHFLDIFGITSHK